MSTERTPEEMADQACKDAGVHAVLEQAVENLTSWKLAHFLDEPAHVCEAWIDRVWDGLRDALDDEDRLLAIARLIDPQAQQRVLSILREGR